MALEKLRRHFSRHGLTLSSAALAGVLAENALAAMPPGFASIVAASSLAGLSTTTVTTVTVMKTMLMTKIKAGVVGCSATAARSTNQGSRSPARATAAAFGCANSPPQTLPRRIFLPIFLLRSLRLLAANFFALRVPSRFAL